jgi:hypothetical protein
MALVQSQQITGSGLGDVLRPLLFVGQQVSKSAGQRVSEHFPDARRDATRVPALATAGIVGWQVECWRERGTQS